MLTSRVGLSLFVSSLYNTYEMNACVFQPEPVYR